jgi:hypothetical protein
MVRRGLEEPVASTVLSGPVLVGLHAVGEGGLAILEGHIDDGVSRYLDGLVTLHRSEHRSMWTLAVAALVRLVGADRPDVRAAAAELRAELQRTGGLGLLEALERELAAATGASALGDGPGRDLSTDTGLVRGEAHGAARPTPA